MTTQALNLKQKLSNAPSNPPRFSTKITNKAGNEVICGDPNITRALVAMMDLAAVNGGAASHWGGPAAIAECMSALHSIMFTHDKWFNKYNFVNDIGHAENGIYALRANLGFGDLDFKMLVPWHIMKMALSTLQYFLISSFTLYMFYI